MQDQKRSELRDGQQAGDKKILQSMPDSSTRSSSGMMLERKTVEKEESPTTSDDFLTMFLESSECSAFMENKVMSLENLLAHGDDAIISYTCNDIKRQELLLANAKMETFVADHAPGAITCELALEMKLLENQSKVIEKLITFEVCKEEVMLELEVVRERRMLEGDDKKDPDDKGGKKCRSKISCAILIAEIILEALQYFF